MRRKRSEAGVTLIEMLVVVTIIGLFVALVGPSLWKNTDKARVTAARSQIQNFMTALGSYKLDTGMFPTTEQGLAALRVKPDSQVAKDQLLKLGQSPTVSGQAPPAPGR